MANRTEELEQLDDLWAEDDETATQVAKYLFFNLGDDIYGVNIMNVTEIIEMQRITQIPDMPDYIKGVINLRGKVIPLMDLRIRFGMPPRDYDDRTCIVVTNIDSASLGIIVDTVAEVHNVLPEHIEKAPNFSGSGKENYVEGVARVQDRVTVLVDAQKILRGKDLQTVKQAASN